MEIGSKSSSKSSSSSIGFNWYEHELSKVGKKLPICLEDKYPGRIKMKSDRKPSPYPPFYGGTLLPLPQYSSMLERLENEPYKHYEPIVYDPNRSADFPDPDNLSDYDDDSVVVPEGLDPVYYKMIRRDAVALDRYLANRFRRRTLEDVLGPESGVRQEMCSAGMPFPGSDQTFKLKWATPCTGERRADDNGADYTICVGNLSRDVTDYVLQETFRAHYTSVKGAKVVTDWITGLSKGYGFVRFTDEAERDRAMVEMNGAFCSSRPMRIGPAATMKPFGAQQYEKAPYHSDQGNLGEADHTNTSSQAVHTQYRGGYYGHTTHPQDPTMYYSGYPGYGSFQQPHQAQGQGSGGYYGYGQGTGNGQGYSTPPQDPIVYSSEDPGYGSYQHPHQRVLPHS